MDASKNNNTSSSSSRKNGESQNTTQNNGSSDASRKEDRKSVASKKSSSKNEQGTAEGASSVKQGTPHSRDTQAFTPHSPVMARFLLVGGEHDANRLYARLAEHQPWIPRSCSNATSKTAESTTSIEAVNGNPECDIEDECRDYEWVDQA